MQLLTILWITYEGQLLQIDDNSVCIQSLWLSFKSCICNNIFLHLPFTQDQIVSIGLKYEEFGGRNSIIAPFDSKNYVTLFDLWAPWLSITITLLKRSNFLSSFLKKFSTVSMFVEYVTWWKMIFIFKLTAPIIVTLFSYSLVFWIIKGKTEFLGYQILFLIAHILVEVSSINMISFFLFICFTIFLINSTLNWTISSSVLEL